MNIDRLNKLATLLEKDAANPQGVKFDLGTWSKPVGSPTDSGAYDGTVTKVPVDCGTYACALGLAAISGVFKGEGLDFKITAIGALTPTFDGNSNYGAGEAFFDLDSDENAFLFDPAEYATIRGADAELEVVRRIKYLIAGGDYREYER